MPQSYAEKSVINGIGKFGTLSELLKRNLHIQVTFGNSNVVDTITIDNIRTMNIQVIYPDGDKKKYIGENFTQ